MERLKYPMIEAERIKHGITKQAFADALGVNERTVKNWQNGRTAMPLSKLVKICSILGCRADYLLGLEVSV